MSNEKNSLFLVNNSEEAVKVARERLKLQPGTDFELQLEWPGQCGVNCPLWMRMQVINPRLVCLEFFYPEKVNKLLSKADPDFYSRIKFEDPCNTYKHLIGSVYAVKNSSGLRSAAIAYAAECHDDSPHITIEEQWTTEGKFPCVVSLRSIGQGMVVINSVMREKDLKRARKALDKWD